MTKVVPRTAFKKGEKRPNQGKRGPDKLKSQVKEAILKATELAGQQNDPAMSKKYGGVVAYLVGLAVDEPKTFGALLGKLVPLDITNDGGKFPSQVTFAIHGVAPVTDETEVEG